MKHLSRAKIAAVVAALLIPAGLAVPAHAAPTDCVVTIADKSVDEGDTGTSPLSFTVTATPGVPTGCDGKTISYAFTGVTATAGSSSAAGADLTATNGTLTFDVATGAQTEEISVTVFGDTTIEPNETLTVTLSETEPDLTLTTPTATGTIVNDDFLRPDAALTISPVSGPAGTVITVSGTGCEFPTVDVFLSASSGQSGGIVSERKGVPVSATTRAFSTTITVPAGSNPALTYAVGAACGSDSYTLRAFDVTGPATVPTGSSGYRMVAADGGIFTFGDRIFRGSTGAIKLNKPIVGGATDTSDFDGYWIVASDGGVFTFNADFFGSLATQTLPSPAVEIEPTSTGKGYWIVLANGKVHNFGDAKHFGDFAGNPLNKPVIGMSVTTTGLGYWLVAQDGGIFSFGDAKFFGSTGDKRLNAPIIDLAPAVDNNGYYLLGADGGVFSFGSAVFKGSTGAIKLNAPVVAMLVAPTGAGYWLAASDGGIFTFGAVNFLGSMGATRLNSPVLDLIN